MGDTENKEPKVCVLVAQSIKSDDEVEKHRRQILRSILGGPGGLSENGFKIQDINKIDEQGMISVSKMDMLGKASLVVVDLTGRDPNVFYEMAARHAQGKPCILLMSKKETKPVDVDSMNVISYENLANAIEAKALAVQVAAVAKQLMINEDPQALDNPIILAKLPMQERQIYTLLREQVKLLNRLAGQIADTTRKPLNGLEEIFLNLGELLEHAREGSRLWYVGMTLGLGVVHRYRYGKNHESNIEKIDQALKKIRVNAPSYMDLMKGIRDRLKQLISNSVDAKIVCLNHSHIAEGGEEVDLLKEKFLAPLCKRGWYAGSGLEENLDEVAKEIRRLHFEISNDPNEMSSTRYLDSLPLQLVIVERSDGGRACMVFHVGTANIGAKTLEEKGGELGFYSEIEQVVSMFERVAETLYDSAKPREG